jgi:hypothetical protein
VCIRLRTTMNDNSARKSDAPELRKTKRQAYTSSVTEMHSHLQEATHDLFVPSVPWPEPLYVWTSDPPVVAPLVRTEEQEQLVDRVYSLMEEHIEVHHVGSQISTRPTDRPASPAVGHLVICFNFINGTKTDLRDWFVGEVLEVKSPSGGGGFVYNVWEYGNPTPAPYSSSTTHKPKWQQTGGLFKKRYNKLPHSSFAKTVHDIPSSSIFDWDVVDVILSKTKNVRMPILNYLDSSTKLQWSHPQAL